MKCLISSAFWHFKMFFFFSSDKSSKKRYIPIRYKELIVLLKWPSQIIVVRFLITAMCILLVNGFDENKIHLLTCLVICITVFIKGIIVRALVKISTYHTTRNTLVVITCPRALQTLL